MAGGGAEATRAPAPLPVAGERRADARAAATASQVAVTPALADAVEDVRALVRLILTGRSAPMAEATRALLVGHDALDVVNGVFVPALDIVGDKYERGEFFLPQLMASAEAVKAGFDEVLSLIHIFNSVSGEQESLRAVLPVVKRYGCAVVGLTLDEDGIPPTAEGRFALAERIVEAAEACGIPRCDVAIDCLVMAAATNQDEVPEILRAVTMVKERLGVRTVLGVSNVSFGLPQRDVVNATFLAAALGAGLDLPIMNPLSARYRDVVAAFRVLDGQDRGAVGYVEMYAQAEDPCLVAARGGAPSGGAFFTQDACRS